MFCLGTVGVLDSITIGVVGVGVANLFKSMSLGFKNSIKS